MEKQASRFLKTSTSYVYITKSIPSQKKRIYSIILDRLFNPALVDLCGTTIRPGIVQNHRGNTRFESCSQGDAADDALDMVTGLRTPNTSPYATKGSLIALYRQCYPQILANFRTGFETACLTRLKLTRLACTEFTAFVRHVCRQNIIVFASDFNQFSLSIRCVGRTLQTSRGPVL